MLTVYNCLVAEHDLRLVALAGIICAIASMTAVTLLRHLAKSRGRMRFAWLAVSSTAIGFGIWATHFIAMIAYAPGLESGYQLGLTLISLVVAVVVTGTGLALGTWRDTIDHHLVGGCVIGFGIGAMHFLGMSAFRVEGQLLWDHLLVAVSLVSGTLLAALAVRLALRRRDKRSAAIAALTLTLAICALHFIAMGAVSIRPDASIVVPASALPQHWMAGIVATVSFTILLLSCAALWLELRDDQRARLEDERLDQLANAAVEGLLLCEGRQIVNFNVSLAKLSGHAREELCGHDLEILFGRETADAVLGGPDGALYEARLMLADGGTAPVELVAQTFDHRTAGHRVVAVRDVAERKRAEADLRRMASNDALTGLLNRFSFTKRLDAGLAAVRRDEDTCLALLLFNLDRFKEVNDLFGHAAGDALLQKVAERVSSLLGQNQMLARLGGDEFAILAPGIAERDEAAAMAQSIAKALRGNRHDVKEEVTTVSIGIALAPQDGSDATELLNHADTALYRAKSEGRDTWRFYDEDMGQEARTRRIVEHELRHATARKEFHLVYQPQMTVDGRGLVGFEALLRWHHPERGNVSPGLFIPIAEECGAIVQIGEWVLRTACTEAASWDSDATIAVNVSPLQLLQPDFVPTVHAILLDTGLRPGRLEIEITETALARDVNKALSSLRLLKALGVRVAMDDFGTGYSSLANLRAFPFDKIKIDGSFIRSVDRNGQQATIVKAVLGLGRGLDLPVLAEGIETADELRFLAEQGCDFGQGYYLGRPSPIESFRPLLMRQATKAA